MTHAKLPWVLLEEGDDEIIRAADGSTVHRDMQFYPSGLASDDAALIVACVNLVHQLAAGGNCDARRIIHGDDE